jgi:hypothetical protein
LAGLVNATDESLKQAVDLEAEALKRTGSRRSDVDKEVDLEIWTWYQDRQSAGSKPSWHEVSVYITPLAVCCLQQSKETKMSFCTISEICMGHVHGLNIGKKIDLFGFLQYLHVKTIILLWNRLLHLFQFTIQQCLTLWSVHCQIDNDMESKRAAPPHSFMSQCDPFLYKSSSVL